jgi:cell division protein FtsB
MKPMACSGCPCSTCRDKTRRLELARANTRALRRQIKALKKESAAWEEIAERYRTDLSKTGASFV